MAVTMKQVRAALDPEEPDYEKAAQLGPEALPHLEKLVNSGDTMLASKAAYLAGLIKAPKSADVVATAAHSSDPAVRVAAAATASNLSPSAASDVLVDLVADPDPGVRKVARAGVPSKPTRKLAQTLKDLGDENGAARDIGAEMEGAASSIGPMPGEVAGEEATMPGERPGAMPGEQQTMPGERD
jgi:HEAT repeat protein